MIPKSEVTDLQRHLTICKKSQRPMTMVCTTDGCQYHPLMCGVEECECQIPHEEHICYTRLKTIAQKIDKVTAIPEEVKKAKVIAVQMFDDINKKIQLQLEKIGLAIEEGCKLESEFEELREGITGRGSISIYATGSMACKMLQQLDDHSKKVRPAQIFDLRAVQMEAEVKKVEKNVDILLEQIRGIFSKTEERLNAHLKAEAISSLSDQDPAMKNLKSLDIGVQPIQIMLENYTNDEWERSGHSVADQSLLTKLSLTNCNCKEDVLLRKFLQFPSIRILKFSKFDFYSDGCSLTTNNYHLLGEMKGLEEITVNKTCHYSDGCSPIPAISKMFMSLPNLRVLDIHNMHEIELYPAHKGNFNQRLLRQSSLGQLKALRASSCFAESILTEEETGDSMAKLIAGKYPKLSELIFSNLRIYPGNNKVQLSGVKAISKGLTFLKVLDISKNNIGDQGLIRISNRLKELQTLIISECGIMLSEETTVAQLPILTTLDISGNSITDNGVTRISAGFPNLTEFRISNNKLREVGASAIAVEFQRLTHLALGDGNKIGNDGFVSIVNGLVRLKTLRLDNRCGVTFNTKTLELVSPLTNLEIDIQASVDLATAITLVKRCSKLYFNFRNNIGQLKEIAQAGQSNKQLKQLSIYNRAFSATEKQQIQALLPGVQVKFVCL